MKIDYPLKEKEIIKWFYRKLVEESNIERMRDIICRKKKDILEWMVSFSEIERIYRGTWKQWEENKRSTSKRVRVKEEEKNGGPTVIFALYSQVLKSERRYPLIFWPTFNKGRAAPPRPTLLLFHLILLLLFMLLLILLLGHDVMFLRKW